MKKLNEINIMTKIMSLKDIKKLLLEIFFPESCIVCSKFGEIVCYECREEIKKDKTNNENIKNIFKIRKKTIRT